MINRISAMRMAAGISAFALLAMPTVASAADEADQSDANSIIVTGTSEGYVATNSVTATKTDTPLKDIPQTIAVVTREQIEDQAHHSMADVLRYIPGVTVGQGEGNRDQITLRGQNSTADFFLDGVRDDVQYYRSLYNIERVEVLKGPYAMIFGRGGGGGIINRVQKTPQAVAHIAGAASVNTFGGYDVSADINQPFGDVAAARVNATYEKLESFRDFVDGERYAINPYLGLGLGGWSLGLSYEYVHDDRVPDRGLPSVECVPAATCVREPLGGNRTTFFGVPGINRAELKAHIAKARLDGELAPGLTWSSTALYGDYDKYYSNVFPNSVVRLSDNTVELDGYRDDTDRENLILQSNLVWDAEFGAMRNKLLVGAEYGEQHTENGRLVAPARARVNVHNLVRPVFAVPFPVRSRATVSDVEFVSVYAQDQLSIGEHIDLIAGIRYDRFEIAGRDQVANRDFGRTDEKWSPRFGVIVKPRADMSLYASYSRSFLPRSGDQFISLTPATEALAPERFTNLEVGAKWDIRPDLSLTAALFQLDRTNTTTPDPTNPTVTIVAGETRTRGAEVALVGRLTPEWQVSAGYAYQDAHIRRADDIRLGQVPEHQLSLWNRYDFNRVVGAGLGVVHQSSQWAALHNPLPNAAGLPVSAATRLPAFTRVDAALFINASDRVELQVNIENLLDEEYFSDAHNNNNITPGTPLNARLTARLKF
jgi:catecholate siderophore receptor